MALAIVHHPAYTADIPADHPLPMGKYRRLADLLVEQGIAGAGSFHRPEPAPKHWLELVHAPAYVDQVLAADVPVEITRDIGLPVTDGIARRATATVGGTILVSRLALRLGIACNTAGGGHHARRDQGAGFCVFNDVAVAIRALQREGMIATALVVDLDVHQGDGTAAIFDKDAAVTTLSIHSASNYPVRKMMSDVDVGLADRTTDGGYLAVLRDMLPALLDRRPDIVFYNAGVDPHRDDRLGRLDLSDEGIIARDRYVVDAVCSRGIPLAGVIGGGYQDDIDALAARHASLHRAAAAWAP